MESLESRWQRLPLSTEEDNEIVVTHEQLTEEIKKGENSLIGKLHVERTIGKEIVRKTMGKIWKHLKPFSVCDFGLNTYIFSFSNEEDRDWVMTRRPWPFESSLLSLKPFDGYSIPAAKMDFSGESFWVHFHDLPIACRNEARAI